MPGCKLGCRGNVGSGAVWLKLPALGSVDGTAGSPGVEWEWMETRMLQQG